MPSKTGARDGDQIEIRTFSPVATVHCELDPAEMELAPLAPSLSKAALITISKLHARLEKWNGGHKVERMKANMLSCLSQSVTWSAGKTSSDFPS